MIISSCLSNSSVVLDCLVIKSKNHLCITLNNTLTDGNIHSVIIISCVIHNHPLFISIIDLPLLYINFIINMSCADKESVGLTSPVENDKSDDFMNAFLDLAVEDHNNETFARPKCSTCDRPVSTCWCPYLPSEKIDCNTTVYILQHPEEQRRRLQTAVILQNGLKSGQCHIIKSRRYNETRYPELQKIFCSENTILMYPGTNALPLDQVETYANYNLVLLDGTWNQTRMMFNQNPILKTMKQFTLPRSNDISEFIIRTQPYDGCLSTCESCATAIALLENRPEIIAPLVAPVKALCKFQIDHGSVRHHSKQYLVSNGLYKKTGTPSNNATPKS